MLLAAVILHTAAGLDPASGTEAAASNLETCSCKLLQGQAQDCSQAGNLQDAARHRARQHSPGQTSCNLPFPTKTQSDSLKVPGRTFSAASAD
jgi:hypothetical protein